ncbi:MAG: regulatory protein RecX [Flavobacteriales bacterium]
MANFCVYQDRCHYDIEKKLREFDLIPEAKDQIILFLLEHNFLNEERFAFNFAQGKFNQKKWGKNRIRRELQTRNIHDRLIKKSLERINHGDYLEMLEQLYLKKTKEIKESNPYKKRQKIYRYLVYKGFESEYISALLNS